MSVSEILARTRVTIEIDGRNYVCRRPHALMYARAFGAGILGLIDAVDSSAKDTSQTERNLYHYLKDAEHARKLLPLAMVSPRLVDDTDGNDSNGISFDDLGDDAMELYHRLLKEDLVQAENFPTPSQE